jgi:uncharacterized protein (DUF433 family)
MATDKAARLDRIEKTPDVCGGDARLRGRRVAVWQLVQARRAGLTDEQIMQSYAPPLSPADLATAWSYFAEHAEEIEEAIRDNEEG